MPRKCTICTHLEREAIDQALIRDASPSDLTAKYRVSPDALLRHKQSHLAAGLTKAHEAQEVAKADDLLSQVKDLQSRAMAILDKAEVAGDLRTAVSAIREARGNLELLAKLVGELAQEGTTTVNLLVAPEWITVRTAILAALTPYPQAAQAVSQSLARLPDAG